MRTLFTSAILTLAALALAGCSLPIPGAHPSSGDNPDPHQAALRFAGCMRQHGITDFPDPSTSGNFQIQGSDGPNGSPSDLDPSSATFQSAQQACNKYLPANVRNGKPDPQMQQKALHFSQCMRQHGITDFPDPTFQNGGAGIQLNPSTNSDLDPNNPQFQAAQQACASILGIGKDGGPTTSTGGGSSTITGGKP